MSTFGSLRTCSSLTPPSAVSDWGYLVVDAIRLVEDPAAPAAAALPSDLAPDRVVLGGTELTARYAAPDDGNPDDRTVLVVDLPRPVGRARPWPWSSSGAPRCRGPSASGSSGSITSS